MEYASCVDVRVLIGILWILQESPRVIEVGCHLMMGW